MRPVFGEDTGAVRVDLGLPLDGHASPFEAQIEPADTGEQAADGERHEANSVGIDASASALARFEHAVAQYDGFSSIPMNLRRCCNET